ncbi:biflaviolin synthase CYP158A2 [Streptomyces mashuensis]|uniref:Biflaviolin synthase CYP158A2 n=1 Tax=Streptomyces mashuensis TaxID=33904 RepID=A0A919B7W3_9ACTN|nr:cytochrome P450 [Streptomyces mashuensis]GHF67933.1 biflaviolin synthase CYP158A2 [Streptomyces mashuensis]
MSDRTVPVRTYEAAEPPGLDFDPFFAELLSEEPLARVRLSHGEGECWVATRYEDVRKVTSDARFSRAAIVGRPFPKMTRHHVPMDRAVSFVDPPEHARVRGVVAGSFSQPAVERLRPRAQQILDGLVDGLLRSGRPADLVGRVTSPFPLAVTSELIGVPPEDRPQMREWAQVILSRASDDEAAARAARVKEEAQAYFRALAARRRARPREDLMSVMVAAVDQGRLDEDELVALTGLMEFNGWHAVCNNTSNMMYLLLTRPELADRLRAEPSLMRRAVDELLRYIPHKHGLGQPRIATEDVEVGGVLVREGEVVYVSYVAANWDASVYPDPHLIDFGRRAAPHVAFGHGPHVCVGPLLARMESEVLLSTLLARLPGLRLAVPADKVEWHTGILIRGPVALPVTWDGQRPGPGGAASPA